jgi:hypothetical protein
VERKRCDGLGGMGGGFSVAPYPDLMASELT